MNKTERVAIVNKIIHKISKTKRGFLKHNGVLGEVLLEKTGLWYIDQYTRKRIYFHQAKYHGFPGFTGGGTLKDMVFGEFKRFINEGAINEKHSHLCCEYWGIPDHEIHELQKYAHEIGYLKIKN